MSKTAIARHIDPNLGLGAATRHKIHRPADRRSVARTFGVKAHQGAIVLGAAPRGGAGLRRPGSISRGNRLYRSLGAMERRTGLADGAIARNHSCRLRA